jgi:hypothetical protein
MDLPEIFNYTKANDFIRDLYNRNKARNPAFSYGFVSSCLSWPPSLIADLIAERRQMTMQRALELGRWLELDDYRLDYLVLLALKEKRGKSISDYIEKKLVSLKPESNLES